MTQMGTNMVVARTRITAIILPLACALFCSAALAADDQPPQTGTIEVEVVYKDTGEPVEGAVAVAMSGRVVLGHATVRDGRARFEPDPTLWDRSGETCTVAIWHDAPGRSGTEPAASTFLWRQADCEQAVAASELLARSPYIFRVERGWHLSGVVKQHDGTPFADALVVMKQGDTAHANAFGVTDDGGRFELAGVEPDDMGQLVVLSLVESDVLPGLWRNPQGAVPLLRRSVPLLGESTSVELEVHTIQLTLDLEIVEPLWPFRSREGYTIHEARIWVGKASERAEDAEIVHIDFDAERRRTLLGIPKGHCRISLPHYPANEAVTVVVETSECYLDPNAPGTVQPNLLERGPTPWSAPFKMSNPLAGSSLTLHWTLDLLAVSRTQVTLPSHSKDQTFTVVHYEPRARLSRALLYGVPSLLVLAADEQPPQTGTIEVEVVYKDTGEPVEGVCVAIDLHRNRDPEEALLTLLNSERTARDGRLRFDGVELGTHEVFISNPLSFGAGAWTRFCDSGSDLEKAATLSAESPVVQVVFEVVRGVRLSGSVTRQDGSSLAGACVLVKQGEQTAYGMTGEDGRFEFLGVALGPVAPVQVCSTIEYADLVIALIPIHEQEVGLGQETGQADLVVTTASLDLTLVVVKPVWPFNRWREDRRHALLIWAGGKPEDEAQGPDARVPLDALQPVSTRSLASEWRRTRLRDVAAGQRITVGLGTWSPGDPVRSPGHVRVPAEFHYRCWRTVEMTDNARQLTLTIYEPYARLSRALLYGVPSLLVLAVCITAIVLHTRKRRRQRGAA